MPELAELKLTAAYINTVSEGLFFNKIEKNPVHKGVEIDAESTVFKISAKSRGKELMVYLISPIGYVSLRMNMGMAGHFQITPTGKESKHAHLKFYSECGKTLSFVDVRRFGKWKVESDWSADRGPDPTQDFEGFQKNIMDNIDKKEFDKPVHLVMMNQKYFNGIGNYLRAEILYRVADANPFLPAREILQQYPDILTLCREIPQLAYVMGGGSIKDWKNPFGLDAAPEHFFQCYSNPTMANIVDANGRRFWYDRKWDLVEFDSDTWCHYSGMPSPEAYTKK
jgi:endonuclease VIII-like 1